MFNLFKKKKDANSIRREIVDFTYDAVQNENGVRVEDAICLISTIVAEKCIDLAGQYNLYDHDYPPGQRMFSDKINQILSEDISTDNWEELTPESVFGLLYENLKRQIPTDKFPSIKGVFQNFAERIENENDWGNVPYTIPQENRPFLLPLRIGIETREHVDKILNQAKLDKSQKLKIVTNSLSDIINQTKQAIDPKVSLTLSLELVNGMSKTATMTNNHMKKMESDLDD